jgi:IMP dehydrogenase
MESKMLFITEHKYYDFDDIELIPGFQAEECSTKSFDLSSSFSRNISLDLPIVSSSHIDVSDVNMCSNLSSIGGIGILDRERSVDLMIDSIRKFKEIYRADPKHRIAVSVGVTSKDVDRASSAIEAGASAIVLEISHGHSKSVEKMVGIIRNYAKSNSVDLIVGNIYTYDAAKFFLDLGVDGVKTKFGNETYTSPLDYVGFAHGRFSVILDVYSALLGEIPLIVEGLDNTADMVKSLAAGASCIALDSPLANSSDSPLGQLRGADDRSKNSRKVIQSFVDGIRLGISYAGVTSLEDFYENAIVRVRS